MKLYNTLTRRKEKFIPLNPPVVGLYSCGPTVYWNQHIGNLYAYIQWDVLVRSLKYLGYKVRWVMNITDVGHLTSDEDSGEDKMEKGAKREKLTVWEIADKYIKQFLDSLDLLNITRPDVLCRATEHIDEQIALIKKIETSGFTYKTKTGLVFDTQKFPDYAKFARLNLKEQAAGARVEIDREKKNPWDFLLWVTNQQNHIMLWDSPWGRGFPGWHIECTAMSVKYLGEQFDIHTGGQEHIPVHHTNEIAQAYGAFGRQTVNYWLHNAWLKLKSEKISKSLGNVYLVTDLMEKGYSPLAFRYLVLTSHYRQGLNFDFKALSGAQTAWKKLVQQASGPLSKNNSKLKDIKQYERRFVNCLNDDLNVAQALALAWEVAKGDLPDGTKREILQKWDQVFGLNLLRQGIRNRELVVSQEIKELVEKRKKLREEKKWEEADNIRKEIEKKGYILEDTALGTKAKKK